jgi:hypothetical protein
MPGKIGDAFSMGTEDFISRVSKRLRTPARSSILLMEEWEVKLRAGSGFAYKRRMRESGGLSSMMRRGVFMEENLRAHGVRVLERTGPLGESPKLKIQS